MFSVSEQISFKQLQPSFWELWNSSTFSNSIDTTWALKNIENSLIRSSSSENTVKENWNQSLVEYDDILEQKYIFSVPN